MFKRWRLILVAIFLFGSGLAAWLLFASPPAVRTVAASRGEAVQAIYATGTVEPVIWAKVSPTTAGRLVAIKVRDGATVKQGEVLAQIDDRELQGTIAELEARLKYWREELARRTSLSDRGIGSRAETERAQSEFLAAEGQLAAARQRLSNLALTAPMDGVVLRQDGEIGEVVDKQQVLFWVGQPQPLRVTADVDEEDIPKVRPGQRALIKADAFPGRVLEGVVAEITPKGDPLNKVYRVRIALPDDTPLLIGMTVEINVVVQKVADALLIPALAVSDGGVFIVEQGKARWRKVAVGIAGRSAVQVLDGLKQGDNVIVDPPAGLVDGARVRPTPSGQP